MVDVSFARPDEREEIARFMQDVFPRAKWPLEGWRSLLARRWSHPGDIYAITARDGGRLVGVLGLVTVERPTALGPQRTANMTSWYILQPYRGKGIGHRMIGLAAADPKMTLTNFTSSRDAVHVLESAGLGVLDRERLIWRPQASAITGLPVHFDLAGASAGIGANDRRILADHAELKPTQVAVETPDGLCTMIYSTKRKRDDYLTLEVLYIGDRDLFARHSRAIANSLLPSDGAVLSVDRRFVPPGAAADAVEPIPVPRYYTPGRMQPEHVDYLYSEVVILDMKMS